jgi:hypothetical protein
MMCCMRLALIFLDLILIEIEYYQDAEYLNKNV